jgi:hypothetical protein
MAQLRPLHQGNRLVPHDPNLGDLKAPHDFFRCFHCGEPPALGAYWMGITESDPIAVCRQCIPEVFGKLLGDAVRDCGDLHRALEELALNAWRALALAKERRDGD